MLFKQTSITNYYISTIYKNTYMTICTGMKTILQTSCYRECIKETKCQEAFGERTPVPRQMTCKILTIYHTGKIPLKIRGSAS